MAESLLSVPPQPQDLNELLTQRDLDKSVEFRRIFAPLPVMRFGNFIFGVALLLVAATLALTITFRNPSGSSSDEVAQNKGNRTDSASRSSAAPSANHRHETQRPRHAKLPDLEELDLVMDDGPSAPALTPVQRQEISKRTPWVKKTALARLDKMTERLDLTTAQQHKIYPELVRSTAGYHPAMVITYPVGFQTPTELASTNKSPDEAIHDSLDPEQQEDFVEEQLNERAWWNEIVAQLEEDFDASVAAGNGPVAAGTAPEEDPAPAPTPDPTEPEQGVNLFDLLNK